jgi:hypothetical protein
MMVRRVTYVVTLAVTVTAGLAGCSGSSLPSPASPSLTALASQPASPGTGAAAAPPGTPAGGFSVTGVNPVPRGGSQDTRAEAGGASCSRAMLAANQLIGGQIASGFAASSLPASAQLLRHFLAGGGTAVSYPASSPTARLARASTAFTAVNAEVQAAVARELRTGTTRVRLTAGQLPLVAFNSAGGDLYWGFRGTQGLSVTGHGQRVSGGYSGTLTYVIRDSYGFPAGDQLGGFGAPMRYLQTVCGAPQTAGGAHWFPDAITVTVPFRPPA